MSDKYDGGPAFPHTYLDKTEYPGMTLRDHFAGLAMQACIISQAAKFTDVVSELAYEQADAMLKEREK